jgi:hypothetical protein
MREDTETKVKSKRLRVINLSTNSFQCLVFGAKVVSTATPGGAESDHRTHST